MDYCTVPVLRTSALLYTSGYLNDRSIQYNQNQRYCVQYLDRERPRYAVHYSQYYIPRTRKEETHSSDAEGVEQGNTCVMRSVVHHSPKMVPKDAVTHQKRDRGNYARTIEHIQRGGE